LELIPTIGTTFLHHILVVSLDPSSFSFLHNFAFGLHKILLRATDKKVAKMTQPVHRVDEHNPKLGVIRNLLKQIEVENDVHVLYAAEIGSRSTGLSTPTSDYDLRLIYVHRTEWYLRVDDTPKTEIIVKDPKNDMDLMGFELRKAFKLLRSSNPTILEMLYSPVIYYQADADLIDTFRELMQIYYNRKTMLYHHLNIVKQNYHDYIYGKSEINRKKYLYILQNLLRAQYVMEREGDSKAMAPLIFDQIIDSVHIDEDNRFQLDYLVTRKKKESGQWAKEPPVPVIDNWIKDMREKVKKYADNILSNQPRHIDTLDEQQRNDLDQRFHDLMAKVVFSFNSYGVKE
jgi:predicted nucleotidyltransferase